MTSSIITDFVELIPAASGCMAVITSFVPFRSTSFDGLFHINIFFINLFCHSSFGGSIQVHFVFIDMNL